MTGEAKRVLRAFRDGRRFSGGMMQRITASAPRRAHLVLGRLDRWGYVVRSADLYRLTVTGRDLGQHLADTAVVHTGITGGNTAGVHVPST
ncbi:MAG: hypothetical protein OYK82_01895 [Gammaproteobacteria bacterium]|nr:hypothetical protein [Gammaproteobacteria bacterium]